ncbi:hypothetical protein DINM_003657 [Dirofilaria immitis]|nr:hypothetical protein [Dirofilaria immitis]
MDLKSLVVLAITVYYVISVNDTLTKTFDEIWCKSFRKIFGVEGERITQHLSVEDLENLTIGIAMDTVADAVNLQLNRRSRILHYRDGKINPPFLTNFLKCKSRRNEAHEDASEYCWSEYTAILFGEENPIHAINASCYFNIFLITSHKDHLKFFITNHSKDETKLIIMIVNNNEIISGRIENRISMKTEILRKKVRISAPICIVGQSDIRDEDNAFENIPLTTLRLIGEPSVVGVNYQDKTKSYFKAGPVYAFIGIRKLKQIRVIRATQVSSNATSQNSTKLSQQIFGALGEVQKPSKIYLHIIQSHPSQFDNKLTTVPTTNFRQRYTVVGIPE